MPTLGAKYVDMLELMGKWRETAVEELEDIANWRGKARLFPFTPEPAMFWSQTGLICAWVQNRHRNVNAYPVQDIYEAVHTWHVEHSAAGIEEQRVLNRTMDRAEWVLGTVHEAIMARCGQSLLPATEEREGGGEATGADETATAAKGEWLTPMSKADMANRLGNVGRKKVASILKPYGLKQAGNRQLWTARVDTMPVNLRKKLEQVK